MAPSSLALAFVLLSGVVIWADQGSSDSCGGFEQNCDGPFTPRCLQNECVD